MSELPLAPSPRDVEFVRVKTTLPVQPLPPSADRAPITTDRLVIRPWLPSDVAQLRLLRTDPEVMQHTRDGRTEPDEASIQAWLGEFMPGPNDAKTYEWAIVLRDTGEVIGCGGTHSLGGEFGWPDLRYLLRAEFWGRGYATEFLRAYVAAWAALPRAEVEIMVDPRTVVGHGEEASEASAAAAEELLIANTTVPNAGSHNVLRKWGWEHFVTWAGKSGRTLRTFRYYPCRKEAL